MVAELATAFWINTPVRRQDRFSQAIRPSNCFPAPSVTDVIEEHPTNLTLDGAETKYAYDALGRLTSVTQEHATNLSSDGEVTYYEYDLAARKTTVTDPKDRLKVYEYDALGRLESVTHKADVGATGLVIAQYAYDEVGRLVSEKDAKNHETTYAYDALGRLTKITQPSPDGSVDGPETEYTYDALGQRLSVIDPLDRVTSFAYDLLGRVKSETGQDPDGSGDLPAPVTSYTYDAEGRMLTKTGSDSRLPVTAYAYDALGRLTKVTEADPYAGTSFSEAPETEYQYDAEGNLTKVIDPEDRETTYDYDLLGRKKMTTAPDPDGSGSVDGSVTEYGYDYLGRTTFVENPNDERTLYLYDFLDRMTEEWQPDPDDGGSLGQPKTIYTYDEVGNVLSVKDPENNVHSYEYDDFDRLETAIDPHSRETTYEYDEVGNLTRKVDRRGFATEYTYDGLDRRTSEIWKNLSDVAVNTISYTYDIGSQLTAASDLRSTYAYTYDGLGRVKTVNNDGSYDVPEVVLTNSYDTAGLRSKVAAEIDGTDDFETTYTYDVLGRIRDIKQTDVSGGNSVSDKHIRYTYAVDGQVYNTGRYESLDLSEFVQQTNFTYDGAGRVATIRHHDGSTTTVQHSYAYDLAGRVTSYANTEDGTVTYDYDDTDQLEGANYSSSQTDETYAYDEGGNRTGTSVTNGTGNQLASDGTYNYTYDNEGNRKRRTNISTGAYTDYVWDHRNRLTSVREYTSAGVQLKRTNYFYDLFDRRIAEDNDTDGNGTVDRGWRFVYDTSGKTDSNGHATEDIVLAFDKDGNLIRRYVHGPAVDNILVEEWVGTNADTWWNFADKLGTIRDRMAYTLSNDQVFWRVHVTYDAFGNVVNETDEYANVAIASTHVRSMKNPAGGWLYGYAGREFDADTDLQYNRARWYDSRRGIFLSEDPVFADRANTYRYAGSGVTNGKDPSGLEDEFNKGWYKPETPPLPPAAIEDESSLADYAGWMSFVTNPAAWFVIRTGESAIDAINDFNASTESIKTAGGRLDSLYEPPTEWCVSGVEADNSSRSERIGISQETEDTIKRAAEFGIAWTAGGGEFASGSTLVGGGLRHFPTPPNRTLPIDFGPPKLGLPELPSIRQPGVGAPGYPGIRPPELTDPGALFRRTGNTGSFSHLQIGMQKRFVQKYAERGGIGLKNVKVVINRQAELVGTGYCGMTNESGTTIILFPDAFASEETLIRTLGHERTHVMQRQLYGPVTDAELIRMFEEAAIGAEDDFWRYRIQNQWKMNFAGER